MVDESNIPSLYSNALAATSVTGQDVTWAFDTDYQTGQFANGPADCRTCINRSGIKNRISSGGWLKTSMASLMQAIRDLK